jgi:glycerol-3-phosphate dehydrogenase
MPICEGIYKLLYEDVPAREVVKALMTRPIKAEFSE